jgi:hypothetical protein
MGTLRTSGRMRCGARQMKKPPHRRCTTDRDFLPWRFSDAGHHSASMPSLSPASENLHNEPTLQRTSRALGFPAKCFRFKIIIKARRIGPE